MINNGYPNDNNQQQQQQPPQQQQNGYPPYTQQPPPPPMMAHQQLPQPQPGTASAYGYPSMGVPSSGPAAPAAAPVGYPASVPVPQSSPFMGGVSPPMPPSGYPSAPSAYPNVTGYPNAPSAGYPDNNGYPNTAPSTGYPNTAPSTGYPSTAPAANIPSSGYPSTAPAANIPSTGYPNAAPAPAPSTLNAPMGYPQNPISASQYPTSSSMQHPRIPLSASATTMPQSMQQTMRQVSMPVPVSGQPAPLQNLSNIPATTGINPPNPTLYCRSTLTKIARTPAVASKTRLSFGLTVTPFPYGADPVPVASASSPILRCNRCRTYLNPYAEVIDQGTRWKCNLCYLINDFPPAYDFDPNTREQIDRRGKPELSNPVYEFIAPAEYMMRPPQPPAYVFLLDVTHAAVSSGMLATAARTILETLDQLPNAEGRTRVALITHDSSLHFYSLTATNGDEARMLCVADLQDDIFLPTDESDLLVSLTEARPILESLLTRLQSYFGQTQATQSALGPAISAALKLLASVGGKVVVVQASPASIGEGALKPRDDPKLLGTSAESALLRPQASFYKVQATECSRIQVCIDMFIGANTPIDLATIGTAARYSGGKVFHYPAFSASRPEDAIKLASDLSSFLSRPVCFESVIRIRASQGITVNSYFGAFFLRSSDLLALPNVNPDHSFTAQLILEDSLSTPIICFQTAVLHTTCHGERRIRVINAAYPVTECVEDIFDGFDLGASIDLLAKMALEKVSNGSLEEARDALTNKVIEVAKAVKAHYRLGNSGQLMLPESLRLLPLSILALLRSVPFRSGAQTPPDIRSAAMMLMRTSAIPDTLDYILPFFFPAHSLDQAAGLPCPETGAIVMPPRMPLTSERLERHGLYFLDNGQTVLIWVGSQIHPELASLVFGMPFAELESGKYTLPSLDNSWSQRINNIMAKRRQTQQYMPVTYLIKEDSSDLALKSLLLNMLVEDRTLDGQMSFIQWLNFVTEKSSS